MSKTLWAIFVLSLLSVGYLASGPQGEVATVEGVKPQLDDQDYPITAIAKSSGALVCPDWRTFQLVTSLRAQAASDNFDDTITNGASRVIDGHPVASPNLKLYGCTMLPAATRLRMKEVRLDPRVPGIPTIIATTASGDIVRGITVPAMLDLIQPPQ